MNDFVSYFSDGHLKFTRYLKFFINALPELLENVPDNIKHTRWHQHDHATCYYTMHFLSYRFTNRWIDRGRLTMIDFLRGFTKNYILKKSLLHKRQ